MFQNSRKQLRLYSYYYNNLFLLSVSTQFIGRMKIYPFVKYLNHLETWDYVKTNRTHLNQVVPALYKTKVPETEIFCEHVQMYVPILTLECDKLCNQDTNETDQVIHKIIVLEIQFRMILKGNIYPTIWCPTESCWSPLLY